MLEAFQQRPQGMVPSWNMGDSCPFDNHSNTQKMVSVEGRAGDVCGGEGGKGYGLQQMGQRRKVLVNLRRHSMARSNIGPLGEHSPFIFCWAV